MKPQNRTTSRGIPRFSRNFSRKFSFHSTLFPEFQKFSVKWFPFSEIQQFPEYLETFPVKFCTKYRCFQIFESFRWIGKHPKRSLRNLTRPSFPSVLKWRYGADYGTCIKLFAHFFYCTPLDYSVKLPYFTLYWQRKHTATFSFS